MSEKSLRVRYAPSPTGLQHIGGIRTALFNYLYARNMGGDFILRIEDTDRTRFFEGALEDIFSTFEWLGITYDEGPVKNGKFAPYFQSERLELYQKYVKELVEKGAAYYCYCDSDRLEKVRKTQEANRLPPGYDRHCRELSQNELEENKKKGITPVIRFKAPLTGTTSFDDRILGKIEVDNKTLQDFVLLKSDGFPTYHLANIVDDHIMEITDVLRAQEWVPSTPNHILLYKAFSWQPPKFCHLPMVMGEDGHKLSKRHGSTHVIEFRNSGYLPEAIINFVSLLGWSCNDKEELFLLEELTKVFDINRINKAPAIFNYSKLKWFNGVYIRKLTIDKLAEMTLPHYKLAKLISENSTDEEFNYLKKVLPLIRDRLELINDAPELSDFMFGLLPPYKTWSEIIPKNVEKGMVIKILEDALEILKDIETRPHKELQDSLYKLAEKYNVKVGAIFMPIRIAITGINKSPELFPVMEILGKERVVERIKASINKLRE